MKLKSAKPPVYEITGARRALSEEVSERERRYVISMGIRTLCFILAIVVNGPLRFVLLIAAVGLPYFAVVIANGGSKRPTPPPVLTATAERIAIDPPKISNQS